LGRPSPTQQQKVFGTARPNFSFFKYLPANILLRQATAWYHKKSVTGNAIICQFLPLLMRPAHCFVCDGGMRAVWNLALNSYWDLRQQSPIFNVHQWQIVSCHYVGCLEKTCQGMALAVPTKVRETTASAAAHSEFPVFIRETLNRGSI
jgi:hypothetical protein